MLAYTLLFSFDQPNIYQARGQVLFCVKTGSKEKRKWPCHSLYSDCGRPTIANMSSTSFDKFCTELHWVRLVVVVRRYNLIQEVRRPLC